MTLSAKNTGAKRPVKAAALTAGLTLTLTACWGGGGEPAESSSPTGSPSTTTASAESTQAASSSAAGSASASGGAYVPASSKGPARNVPVPQMPEEMRQETKAGAEAAVRYWWETLDYLQQTNEPGPMLAASTKNCKLCLSYPKSVNRTYEQGGWFAGEQPEVVSTLGSDLTGEMTVTTLVNLGQNVEYASSGVVVTKTESKQKTPWTFVLTYSDPDEGWKVDWVEAGNLGE